MNSSPSSMDLDNSADDLSAIESEVQNDEDTHNAPSENQLKTQRKVGSAVNSAGKISPFYFSGSRDEELENVLLGTLSSKAHVLVKEKEINMAYGDLNENSSKKLGYKVDEFQQVPRVLRMHKYDHEVKSHKS